MPRDLPVAPLRRCLAVCLLATAGLLATGGWLVPDLTGAATVTATGAPVAFDRVLVWASELVLLACASWLWLVTALVCTDAARGLPRGRRGVPAGVRRILMSACGVALVSTLTAPAGAVPGSAAGDRSAPGAAVQGLPLPDRATAAGHVGLALARQARIAARPAPADPAVVVRPGDTLWSLAAADLPPGAGDAAVTRRWQQIYRANRGLVGPDPDLIQPRQRLRLPRP